MARESPALSGVVDAVDIPAAVDVEASPKEVDTGPVELERFLAGRIRTCREPRSKHYSARHLGE